jgi:DNA-binding winged helix-turn-helix (wHTH) protein/tetratricopeptide (TPR) repeat protein
VRSQILAIEHIAQPGGFRLIIPIDNAPEERDSGVYAFGDWTLNYLSNQLIRGPEVLSIEHRHAALLRLLVSSNNQVVTRDEIFRVVWQRKVVNEESLAVAISQLRKLLNDDARSPRFIKTIPSVGYQFIAPVSVVPTETASPVTKPASRSRLLVVSTAIVALIATAAGFWIHSEQSVPANRSTDNTQLTNAVALLNSNDESSWRQAVADFRRILETEPNNAKAWLGLAEAKMRLLGNKQIQDDNYLELTTLLNKALANDSSLARAHLWLSQLLVWHDQNFKEAQRHFEIALQLDPKDELIQLHYAHFLMVQKRFVEARKQIGTIRNLDPLQYSQTQLAWVRMMEGDYQAAAAELDRIAATETPDEDFHRAALNVYFHLGDEARTFSHMQWFFKHANLDQHKVDAINRQFQTSGMKGVYQWLLDHKEVADVGHFTPPLSWARYAVAVNQRDTAINFLQKAFNEHHLHTQCVAADPLYQPLYDDQRFRELISDRALPSSTN